MPILNEPKQDLDFRFGLPKETQPLLGGDEMFSAEKAFEYAVGRFNVIIGFRNDFARYASFGKDRRDDQEFDEDDVEICLDMLAPDSEWFIVEDKRDPADPSSLLICEYEATTKGPAGEPIELTALHRKLKPHFLACIRPGAAAPQAGDKLDDLALEMNSANTPEAKLDAIIAVLNELIAERGRHRAK